MTETVPQGTITTILAWVDGDPQRARAALDAERAGLHRSTLIYKLNAIASEEASMTSPTGTSGTTSPTDQQADQPDQQPDQQPDDVAAEQEELAPEQPAEVTIDVRDRGVVFHTTAVRDPDVDVPEDAGYAPTPPQPEQRDDDSEIIDGQQVEYIDAASSSNGLALGLNGTTYLLGAQSVGQLKQVIDKAVVGLAL